MFKNRWLIIAVITIIIIVILTWAFTQSIKPKPGIDAFQYGRDHKPIGTLLTYSSNPPTSGNHYPAWITKGFDDTPRWDGFLVHSQEHGYIVFWYDCAANLADDKNLKIGQEPSSSSATAAPDVNLAMTSGSEGSPSAKLEDLPVEFRNGSCDNLKNQIKQVINTNPHKLIAVPRTGLEHHLILTAWGKQLPVDSVDKNKIQDFINAYRDNGPETTFEE